MDSSAYFFEQRPVRVGIVGTGFAAKLRAETLHTSDRAVVVAIVGHTLETTQEFAQNYQAQALTSWQELIERSDLDLVVISNINRDHGAIARAALQTGKHVVVEYPLSLEISEAEEILALAQTQRKLLHVEHIELLGGLHQALKQNLQVIAPPFYARYATIAAQRPAPRKWTYNPELFGFPLSAALSRLHRFTDLFGEVATVSCQNRYWGKDAEFYKACVCTTQLKFNCGLVADLTYAKGEILWQDERKFEVHGETGGLIFDGDAGMLIRAEEKTPIELGTRRGLFVKDTEMVLDSLFAGTPMYVTPSASVYTLKIADAARRSAQTGETIIIGGNG